MKQWETFKSYLIHPPHCKLSVFSKCTLGRNLSNFHFSLCANFTVDTEPARLRIRVQLPVYQIERKTREPKPIKCNQHRAALAHSKSGWHRKISPLR